MSDADSTIVLNLGVGGDTTDASNVATPTQAVPAPTAIKRERVVLGGDAAPSGGIARDAILNFLMKNNINSIPTYDFTLVDQVVPLLTDIRDALRELVRIQGGLQ